MITNGCIVSVKMKDNKNMEQDELKKLVGYNVSPASSIATAGTTLVIGFVHQRLFPHEFSRCFAILYMFCNLLLILQNFQHERLLLTCRILHLIGKDLEIFLAGLLNMYTNRNAYTSSQIVLSKF